MELMQESPEKSKEENCKDENQRTWLKTGALVFGISLFGGLAAGTISAKIAKKKSEQFYKDVNMEAKVIPETPHLLALRALAWATFYSVGLFSLAIFATCKWYGISSLDDLRMKLKKYSGNKEKPDENHIEFESLSDFVKYLESNYSKPKEKQK